MTSRIPGEGDAPPSRGEWLAAALIVVAGLVLRLACPERMAVEHFDEGVYASNLFLGEDEGYQYPDRHLYAPPLLPALIEWSIVFFGTRLGPVLPGVLFGTLTVGLVWWTARRWFGREAALAAALLAATSDFHILFSRTALTDPLLGLWLVGAVLLAGEAYRHRAFSWAVAAGIVTGLAWWTKYSGWLPLAIALAGLPAWLVFRSSDAVRSQRKAGRQPERVGHPARRLVLCWVVMATAAFVIWSPVLAGLPQPDGYAAVQENHRRYLIGLAGWWDALTQQAAAHRHLDGWLTCAGLGLAVLVPAFARSYSLPSNYLSPPLQGGAGGGKPESSQASHPPRPPLMKGGSLATVMKGGSLATVMKGRSLATAIKGGTPVIAVALLLPAAAALLGASLVLAGMAVAGLLTILWPAVSRRQTESDWETLAAWLLAAWFVGLLLATPLYRPYPRLTLPWLIVAWLGAAVAVRALTRLSLVPGEQAEHVPRPAARRMPAVQVVALVAAMLALAVLVWSGGRLTARGVPGWQPRSGLRTIADHLAADAQTTAVPLPADPRAGIDFIVYVYGEPGLFFHLADRLAATAGLVHPVGSLGFTRPDPRHPQVPLLLATGPHAHRSRQFAKEWDRSADLFDEIARYPYTPSDAVLLDEHHPRRLVRDIPQEEVRLYLLR